MIVFNDGYYYILADDHKFLSTFTQHVNQSSVFCQEDITCVTNPEYRFTLWPNTPSSQAMHICYDNKMWNGVTISATRKNFTELWWLTSSSSNARSFFIRNKDVLMKFVHYFNHHKAQLLIDETENRKYLFKFENGFQVERNDLSNEAEQINKLLSVIKSKGFIVRTAEGEATLSPQELQVLSYLSSGFTAKLAAAQMSIAPRTVRHYIENIKIKTHLHQKVNLIRLYMDNFRVS